MMKVDTLGFLAPQGAPPEADPSLGEHVDLLHLTAAPPLLKRSRDILEGTDRFPALSQFRQFLEGQSSLKIVEKADDLQGIGNPEVTGVILGLQETPHDIDRGTLQELYDQGVRVITPSYQDADHPIGSGYVDPTKPLTDRGRQFLVDCEDVGMIVDVSHLGHQTARDLLEFRDSQGLGFPVLASHGGVYELYDGEKTNINNLRNLPWDVLERVVDAGGIVGIYALTFGLSEKEDGLDPLMSQIKEAVIRLGQNAVAFGSDSVYRERDMGEWRGTVEWLTKMVAKSGELEPRFPDTPLDLNNAGKIALLEGRLLGEGLDTAAAKKVAGANAENFFNSSLRS